MGWPIMIALAAAVFGGLWWLGGMRRSAFECVGAALILAFAGYQWQGRPGLAGVAAEPEVSREQVAASLIALRNQMDRNFSPAKRYVTPSDGYARRGDYVGAVQILRGGTRANPSDADLWDAIGLQMVLAADGHLPPAAKLAFARAQAADPRHPGPLYFTGLAALREGEPEAALVAWSRLLSGDYRAGDWRQQVTVQVNALGQVMRGVMDAAPSSRMPTAAPQLAPQLAPQSDPRLTPPPAPPPRT